ncbi:MAG TPA: dTMP kinase [Blastocatellia bacterium]|nr:dTMP kinase [Blastocatellia bacterium]
MRGLFITLEGIDGCGKSTQFEMLARALTDRGLPVTTTHEPGGTGIGRQIRPILMSKSQTGLDPLAEFLLMAADRAQDVAEKVRPALERGDIVIADRFIDSSVAFQGYGRGVELAAITAINRLATRGLEPDLTILFDLEPATAAGRLAARTNGPTHAEDETATTRFDVEAIEFHRRVREGYLKLAAEHPSRIRVVDASGSVEAAHEQVMALVMRVLSPEYAR